MKNLRGKSAILYRRVSTTEQKLYGNSLNAQKSSLVEFCVRNSINIIKEFQEDFSAKDFNRPEWKRLQEFAKKHKNEIDYLLVVDWDRFSRNTYEALGVIRDFQKLSIEVNSINKWVDYNDPSQFFVQLIYLGMPQVDNEMRSEKIKTGMRQGLLEGRWNVKQPLGYLPGRDELGKPLMYPDPLKSPLIKELFIDYSTGNYSQNELIHSKKYKTLHLSRSNLSRILQNILYIGKIRVPASNNQTEKIVTALHQPIVDKHIFEKVQYQLQQKSRYKQKPKKQNDILFLRGHLKCCKCGGNLTGSGSKSKTGKKHYYYHCNTRKGCNERFRAEDAHLVLFDLLRGLKCSGEVIELFRNVLEDYYKSHKDTKYERIREVESQISYLKGKQEKLLDKLLNEVIDDDLYKSHNKNIQFQLNEMQFELSELNNESDELLKYIDFGVTVIQNLDELLLNSSIEMKNKLLSSIFKNKLEFNGEDYRTLQFQDEFDLIYQNMNKIALEKNKMGAKFENDSHFVLEAGLEPARP